MCRLLLPWKHKMDADSTFWQSEQAKYFSLSIKVLSKQFMAFPVASDCSYSTCILSCALYTYIPIRSLWRIYTRLHKLKDYDNIWSVATISCLLWKLDYKNETNLICGAIFNPWRVDSQISDYQEQFYFIKIWLKTFYPSKPLKL